MAVSLLVVGWLAGMLFRRTVAGAAIGLTVGGTVGAGIALFNGEAAHAPGLLLMALAGWLLYTKQTSRIRAMDARLAAAPGAE